jgi:signal transduction histidine kinase
MDDSAGEILERLAVMERLGWAAAGLAHDVNNALVCVLAEMGEIRERLGELRLFLASVLGTNAGLPSATVDACERSLETMGRGVEAAVLQGRDLQRLYQGDPTVTAPRRMDLREAVGRAVGIAPTHVRGMVEIGGGSVEVAMDRQTLTRIVLNLLLNAADALPADAARPRIRVQIDTVGPWARCDVSDNGGGVTRDVEPRLFEPFATSKAQGGLGLAISRHLARGAGGDLVLLNTGPGGSTFRLLLPRAG